MDIHIPYGPSYLTFTIPESIGVDRIEPRLFPAVNAPLKVVRSALDDLQGDVDWAGFAGSKTVAVAVNDKTRPVPNHHLLPPLFDKLEALGIPDQAITLYVAVGTHTPMPPEEFPSILPESILSRCQVVSHDSAAVERLIDLGKTSYGTPVWVNEAYFRSDLKIAIGNIEPHQFAGFSGGVKSAAIGLAGNETIRHNHAMMTHPASKIGSYDTNPARQDLEQIGRIMGVHLALNAILNKDRQIVKVLAGDPRAIMQAGIRLSRQICQVGVPHPYSLIITSPGGHPKDINVYQAQKALAHAALVTRPGGTILLVAACPEGSGSQSFEEWVAGKHSYAEVIAQFQAEGFRIGPHKAFQIARDAARIRLFTYTDLDDAFARDLLLNPVVDLQTTINLALEALHLGERVGVIPHANATIPYVQDPGDSESAT